MSFSTEEWVTIASAGVAVFSLMLNWVVVRRQIQLQYESLKAQMEADVLAWAQEVIDVLSEGIALARGRAGYSAGATFRCAINDTARRLSGLADRGRLFFPNERFVEFGTGKEAAYRGLRPAIIDAVVFACCCLESVEGEGERPDEGAVDILTRCRRLTVSEAQNAINPRRRAEILKQLAEGRKDDEQAPDDVVEQVFDALQSRAPESPVVKMWAISREARKR